MSILGGMALGAISGAGAAMNEIGMKQIQADIEEQRQARLVELQTEKQKQLVDYGIKAKEDAQARENARTAGIINSVPTSIEEDGPGGDKVSRPLSEKELNRARLKKLEESGEFGAAHERLSKGADRLEDNDQKAADRQDAHDKWVKQFDELTRHHKELESKAASDLNLKTEDRKALSSAMDNYKSILKFRTMMSPDSPAEDISKVDGQVAAAGAALSQWGIKVPGVESDKRGGMKVVKGEIGEGDTLVHESSKGSVTRIDPKTLPVYGDKPANSADEQVYSDARKALAAGMSRDEVNKRLRKNGYSPI